MDNQQPEGKDGRRLRQPDEALRQSNHELEVVRQFSTAIAHDFNNSIAAILGWAEFALDGADPQSAVAKALTQISKEARHAARLTRELAGVLAPRGLGKQEAELE